MPATRVSMRKTREILRLRWGLQRSLRDTAASCALGSTTVHVVVARARAAGRVDETHIVGEIGEVLAGRIAGRRSPLEITAYKSLGSVAQDLEALRLDPTNAEAHADLGWVLFQAGKPDDALRAEEQALQADPQYAEAMYFQGVILLRGLDRPADAAVAFRAYLAAAPFGSHRDAAQQLLAQATTATPSP